MKVQCYAMICTDGDSVWTKVIGSGFEDSEPTEWGDESVLVQMLQEGWVPIRESPMSGTSTTFASSLVTLETDAEEETPA